MVLPVLAASALPGGHAHGNGGAGSSALVPVGSRREPVRAGARRWAAPHTALRFAGPRLPGHAHSDDSPQRHG